MTSSPVPTGTTDIDDDVTTTTAADDGGGGGVVVAPPPQDANAECVGPTSADAGKASACEGCPNQAACSSGANRTPEALAKAQEEQHQLQQSLQNISHTILVLSGKGGVGKSTVASQLAHTLACQGYAVGLLDVDLCGPSAPRMVLGDAHRVAQVTQSAAGAWIPVYSTDHPNLACMSISFLLQDHDSAVVWRGPRKNGLIQQFLTQVDWTGETDGLDYLIVDTPPGTSDEHISTVQYLQKAGTVSGAILVTTPEEVSMADVRKELNFCQKTKVPILGVIENMGQYMTPLNKLQFKRLLLPSSTSGGDDGTSPMVDCTQEVLDTIRSTCPHILDTLAVATIYPQSGGGPKGMAERYNVPYWGILPMDPDLLEACERGRPFVQDHPTSMAAKALVGFCSQITTQLKVEEVG